MSDSVLYLLTEAAERTGLTVEALRQRIKRHQIVAVKGNDRLLRVRLSQAEIDALQTGRPVGQLVGQPTGQPVEESFAIKGLAAALHDAMEGRKRAEETLQAERREWTGRLDRLTDDLAEARRQRDTAVEGQQQAEMSHQVAGAEARAASARVVELEAELRMARRPWWSRVLRR